MRDFYIKDYIDYYYIISYKNNNLHHRFLKDELLSIQYIENISLFMKIYVQKDNCERWIVLFTNDNPSLVISKITYYYMTTEKSIKDYQYNILDNNEENIIQHILDKNPL